MAVPEQYQKPPQAPPVFTHTKDAIMEETTKYCNETRSLLDKLVADVAPEKATFDSVVKPMAHAEDQSSLLLRILNFYQYVSAAEELRKASTESAQVLSEFDIECGMREDIFKLVKEVKDKGDKQSGSTKLDPESDRLLEREYRGFLKYGLTIPAGPKRDRFKEIKTRLRKLEIEFQKNLNEENDCLWFSPEQLDGAPQDMLDGLEKGKDENEGKLRVTFKYPDVRPAMRFVKNPETREKIYLAKENICKPNVALFDEIVLLRDEAARLLGYPNHAAMRIEHKMAKTPEKVNDFLAGLRKRLTPGGAKEREKLKEIKKDDVESRGLKYDGKLWLWDHSFYDRMMIERDFNVDENKVAEYFPIQNCISSMLKIFEELMGLAFVELTAEERAKISPTGKAEDIAWHEDVRMFSVWNDKTAGNGFVGYLYLDLHPRPGKYSHAANFNLQPGFRRPDGSRRYPATALVCNFSKPTAARPSLLKHSEVVTLFHELGHGIHDLTAKTTYSRFHGTATVRDFVEAPSQMLENWCWTHDQLKHLSSHYKTGESLPDELIEKIIASKHVNGANFSLRQLHFGIFDMTVHAPSSRQELEKLDVTKTFNQLRSDICAFDGPEDKDGHWGCGQATFGHLAGGYDAGYYGYLWSLVFSTDMFYTRFKANPMDGKIGRTYRQKVLEKGGSHDEEELLKDFLGREPNAEAFYEELGIKE